MTEGQIEALKEPGGARRNVFTAEERAAIQFAERLTAWPATIRPSDHEELGRYFNAAQIAELVLTIGTANLTNRFNEGMQTPVDT